MKLTVPPPESVTITLTHAEAQLLYSACANIDFISGVLTAGGTPQAARSIREFMDRLGTSLWEVIQ